MPADIPRPRDPASPGTPPAEEPLLDAGQVAEILGGGITKGTVIRNWSKWGLPAYRVTNKSLRWKPSDLRAYIESRRVTP